MSNPLVIKRPGVGDIVILLFCLMLIPASLMSLNRETTRPDTIHVTTSDAKMQVYPLAPNRILQIHGRLGVSEIEIKDGAARFASSPCSGQHCVLSGWHNQSGSGMACLPNRVSITLHAQDDNYDGMNY